MEIKKTQVMMLSCCFFAGGLMLVGCSTDDSIDVGEVDTTIGVKLNDFSVPLGSAEDITLGDVLDLKENDCIHTNGNGDYEFFKDGGEVTGAEPKVDPVKFANPQSETFAFSFNPSSPVSAGSRNSTQGIIPDINVPAMPINAFSFSNEPIKEIISLTHAKASSAITLNLNFKTVATLASHVTLGIEFPKYLELEIDNSSIASDLNVSFENNKLTLTNVSTSKGVNGLRMILTNVVFANDITLMEATGYFDPSIEINDMGNINIGNDVPDFLKDDEVFIKLANPCITLNVTNTIDAKGIIDGQMIATYDDKSKKTVNINGIIVKPHTAATG